MKLLFLSLFVATCVSAVPTPLFNGRDLSGWTGSGYVVEDGAITCTPEGRNLATDKQYTNYVFDFEFRLPPAGNNGIGIHYPGEGNPAYVGIEIQVLDNDAPKYDDIKDTQVHGSLYLLQGAKRGHLKPVGEWNHEKITVRGDSVVVELNGHVINDANLAELARSHPDHEGVKRRSGHIALCGHGDRVQFRKLTIDELKAGADPAR